MTKTYHDTDTVKNDREWNNRQYDRMDKNLRSLRTLAAIISVGSDDERIRARGDFEDGLKRCHNDLFEWMGERVDYKTFDWDGLVQMIKETPLTMWRQRRSKGERAFRSREGAARVARAHISKIEDKLGRMAQHMEPTGGVVDVLNKVREGKYILPFHLEGEATWDDATEYQNWVDELTALIDEWYCELVGEYDEHQKWVDKLTTLIDEWHCELVDESDQDM